MQQRDDVSVLYKFLGRPSQGYLDFHTEEDFCNRVNVVMERRAPRRRTIASRNRNCKIIGVISIGDLHSRKLVASLAAVMTHRMKTVAPVHIVDLIPVNHSQEEKSFLAANGIRHVLIDSSAQAVRMEETKEIEWLERQIISGQDEGLVLVDVPESVLHVRQHAIAAADMLVVLIPSSLGSVRAIEEVEAELAETISSGVSAGVYYLFVETSEHEALSPFMKKELLSHQDLLIPVILNRETLHSSSSFMSGRGENLPEYPSLVEISNFIVEKLGK